MTGLFLPPIEDLELDDLAALPRHYRYELRDGNLVIAAPSSFWHKVMAGRVLVMLHKAGLNVFQDPGVRGDRPRDCRVPDLGVASRLPLGLATYSHLPASSFNLVVEVVSEGAANGEYTDKAAWYAEHGIPEYWIVDQAPDRADDDAFVFVHRLLLAGGEPIYGRERNVLLSELEREYPDTDS
ncbi:Uma2 family endonuclease [Paractinoplanes hotanensis]|uniref:Uma2 family endonuclease n=1 Tax=Paractinoplanes hotanensis TaxID=2906497 RepID=A0ABT0XZA8_9ACTN|nr:Uma2 family endonuclease [Actinoplanes hotanensis]MCM4079062.1 Uma2 family endonuclease [Actinoplanes hotanensis]